jgi:hypothetical protein
MCVLFCSYLALLNEEQQLLSVDIGVSMSGLGAQGNTCTVTIF